MGIRGPYAPCVVCVLEETALVMTDFALLKIADLHAHSKIVRVHEYEGELFQKNK